MLTAMIEEAHMGEMHDKAQQRLKDIFDRNSQVCQCYTDKAVDIDTGGRLGIVTYFADVLAFFRSPSCRAIWIEVDGKVGHTTQRSNMNREQIKIPAIMRSGYIFFAFSTKELVGNGWVTSRGYRIKPWKTEYLEELFFSPRRL